MADLDELERLEKAANILQYGKLSFGRAGNADLVAFNGEDVTGIASFGNVHRAAYVAALCNALPELLARLRAAEAKAETLYGIAMNAAAWLAQNRTDGGPLNRHESEKLDERMCVKALDIRTAIDAARGKP